MGFNHVKAGRLRSACSPRAIRCRAGRAAPKVQQTLLPGLSMLRKLVGTQASSCPCAIVLRRALRRPAPASARRLAAKRRCRQAACAARAHRAGGRGSGGAAGNPRWPRPAAADSAVRGAGSPWQASSRWTL